MSFEVKREEKDGKPFFKFCGEIDEEANFPAPGDFGSHVFIDLGSVSAINSIGIRAWIMWFSEMKTTQFTFLNCPKALVMQMNMVEGFLPDQSEVHSMEVPFYCEDCDEEKNVMFEVGKEIQISEEGVKLNFDKSKVCGEGCDPELDVNESKFFRFLQPKADSKAA